MAQYYILPYNIPNCHWALYILSHSEKKLWYLDSYQTSFSVKQNVVSCIERYFSVVSLLEVITPKVPQQQDAVNRGIFLLSFVEKFLQCEDKQCYWESIENEVIDPSQKRKEIHSLILQKSLTIPRDISSSTTDDDEREGGREKLGGSFDISIGFWWSGVSKPSL